MTKKATRRGNAMSLRDFYETAPGEAPIETCLPSKPGDSSRDSHAVAVTEYPSKFAPPQRDPPKQTSSYKRYDHSNGYHAGVNTRGPASGYIKASYDRQEHDNYYGGERAGYTQPPTRSQPHHYPQERYPARLDQYSNSPYQFEESYNFYQPPPPPPPPRRPAVETEQAPLQPPPPPPRAPVDAAEPPLRSPPQNGPAVEVSLLTQELTRAVSLNVSDTACGVEAEAVEEDVAADNAVDVPESDLSSSAPKNDWAEKMARNALERMAHAKSSLLAGTNIGLDADSPAETSNNDNTGGPFVKPSHPFERPRLNLKPRSQPLPIAQSGSAASSPEPASAAGTTPDSDAQRRKLNLQPRSLPLHSEVTSKDAELRPRLQLQARSKPLADTEANKDSTARKSASIFGAARPREEVLKERGVDPATVVAERMSDRLGYGSFSGSNGSRPSSRAASVASGVSEDDAWHTVSNKKTISKQQSQPFAGDSYDVADDVFFSSGKPAFGRSHGRSSDYDSLPGSGYGSPAPYNGVLPHSNADEDEGPVFRRSLPVRAGQVF